MRPGPAPKLGAGPGVASLNSEKKDSEMNRPRLIPAAIPIAVALCFLMNLVVITAKADAANPLGTLGQLSGKAGCLSAFDQEECTGSEPVQNGFRLTSSADGRNVCWPAPTGRKRRSPP